MNILDVQLITGLWFLLYSGLIVFSFDISYMGNHFNVFLTDKDNIDADMRFFAYLYTFSPNDVEVTTHLRFSDGIVRQHKIIIPKLSIANLTFASKTGFLQHYDMNAVENVEFRGEDNFGLTFYLTWDKNRVSSFQALPNSYNGREYVFMAYRKATFLSVTPEADDQISVQCSSALQKSLYVIDMNRSVTTNSIRICSDDSSSKSLILDGTYKTFWIEGSKHFGLTVSYSSRKKDPDFTCRGNHTSIFQRQMPLPADAMGTDFVIFTPRVTPLEIFVLSRWSVSKITQYIHKPPYRLSYQLEDGLLKLSSELGPGRIKSSSPVQVIAVRQLLCPDDRSHVLDLLVTSIVSCDLFYKTYLIATTPLETVTSFVGIIISKDGLTQLELNHKPMKSTDNVLWTDVAGLKAWVFGEKVLDFGWSHTLESEQVFGCYVCGIREGVAYMHVGGIMKRGGNGDEVVRRDVGILQATESPSKRNLSESINASPLWLNALEKSNQTASPNKGAVDKTTAKDARKIYIFVTFACVVLLAVLYIALCQELKHLKSRRGIYHYHINFAVWILTKLTRRLPAVDVKFDKLFKK